MFYAWIFFKLCELIFFRRKKFSVRERIERKYIYSHGEMIKSYTPEELELMQVTIANTHKNAVLINKSKKSYQSNQFKNKKVNFKTTENLYYDPPALEK